MCVCVYFLLHFSQLYHCIFFSRKNMSGEGKIFKLFHCYFFLLYYMWQFTVQFIVKLNYFLKSCLLLHSLAYLLFTIKKKREISNEFLTSHPVKYVYFISYHTTQTQLNKRTCSWQTKIHVYYWTHIYLIAFQNHYNIKFQIRCYWVIFYGILWNYVSDLLKTYAIK